MALSSGGMLPADTTLAGAINVDTTTCDSSSSSGLTIGRLATPGNTGQADGAGNPTYPLAAGCDAKAISSGTAFGTFATATGGGSSAFGFNVQATGKWATALGLETVANALGSTALGFGSNATGTNAVSIGGAAGSGTSALSVANSTTASGVGAIAIGSNTTRGARASGSSSVALAGESTASGARAIAVGEGAQATANDTIAMGSRSVASGIDSIAIGRSNNVTTGGSQALGSLNFITSTGDAVAIGDSNSVTGGADNAVLLGDSNRVTSVNGVALGNVNMVSGRNGVAVGNIAVASGENSLALGSSATATSTSALALGNEASASGEQAIAIGEGAVASGSKSLSVGHGNTVSGAGSGAFGDPNTVSGDGSYAVGNDNTIEADNAGAFGSNNTLGEAADNSYVVGFGSSASAPRSLAFGDNASVGNADSVALGSNSTTAAPVSTASTSIAGHSYDFAGTSPVGTVSVGSEAVIAEDSSVEQAASQRTLTNVAAGRVSANSTDAVNGSQLFAATEAIETLDEGAVQYDRNTDTDGTVNTSSVTLEGSDGTTITNLADGAVSADSSDAINGSQLHATNQNVAGNTDDITALDTRVTSSEGDIDSLEEGLAATTAAGVKYDRNADGTLNTSSVTLEDSDGTTITNLADGAVSADSSDAINGSQLHATNQNVSTNTGNIATNTTNISTNTTNIATNTTDIDSLESGLAATTAAGVKYDRNADGTLNTSSVTLEGSDGTTITNLADGAVSADSSDAINGSQLHATNQNVAGNTDDITALDTRVTSSEGDIDSLEEGLASTTAAGVKYDRNADGTLNTSSVTLEGIDGTTITNLADGEVAADSSDAINGSQLHATNQNVSTNAENITTNAANISTNTTSIATNVADIDSLEEGLASTTAAGVKYDRNAEGELDTSSVTLEGTDGTTITNLDDGEVAADSSDAINGSQLHATNQNVAGNTDDITALDTRVTSSEGDIDSLQDGLASTMAAGVKYDRNAEGELDTSSVTLEGTDGTTITNLADGAVAADSSDAINGSQLHATNQNVATNAENITTNTANISTNTTNIATNTTDIDSLQEGLAATTAAGVKYDRNADGTLNTSSVTLEGTGGTTITNLADGEVAADSSDAINGSQLHATNQNVATNTTDIDSLEEGLASTTAAGVKYDRNAEGELDTSSVTLEGTDGTTITNLDDGEVAADSSDAINGSQLHATNQNVATNAENITTNTANISTNTTDIDSLEEGLAATTAAGVKYDRNAEGELDTSNVTLEGTDGTTITNLADGEVAADSSDAINGSQLHATNRNVSTNTENITTNTTNIATNSSSIVTNTTDIDALEESTLKYDRNADGTLNTGNVILEGDNGTKISNLADATESQDAVSLRQLRGAVGALSDTGTLFFHANSAGGRDQDSLALGEESIAVGPLTTVNADHGTGIGYEALVETSAVRGMAIGDRSRVSGARSLALGADAFAGTDNSVALGAGAVSGSVDRVEGIELYGIRYGFAGTPVGTVSIGAAGAERTLTNVAPGRVSADSTDAVNGSQLHATNQAVAGVGERVDGVEASVGRIGDQVDTLDRRVDGIAGQFQGMADSAVQYDEDSHRGQVTLMGELGTKVTNLADGEISQGSTEAVNGGQLWEVQQQLSQGQGSPVDFQSNSQGTAAASATGANAVAAGGGAQATADGGVALGTGAVADRPGMNGEREAFSEVVVNSNQGALSVGSRGNERQVTHVAGGSEDTDAVNVRQLRSVQQGAVNYDRQADGSVDYRSVSLGNGGSEPVQVHNVAAGSAPNDAVNVSQLSALDSKYSTAYGNLSDRIDQVERDASAGIAAVAAMGDAPYVAGKLTYHVGTGYHNGESALGVSMRRTADNGRWSLGMGVGASSADATLSFGVSGVID